MEKYRVTNSRNERGVIVIAGMSVLERRALSNALSYLLKGKSVFCLGAENTEFF